MYGTRMASTGTYLEVPGTTAGVLVFFNGPESQITVSADVYRATMNGRKHAPKQAILLLQSGYEENSTFPE